MTIKTKADVTAMRAATTHSVMTTVTATATTAHDLHQHQHLCHQQITDKSVLWLQ